MGDTDVIMEDMTIEASHARIIACVDELISALHTARLENVKLLQLRGALSDTLKAKSDTDRRCNIFIQGVSAAGPSAIREYADVLELREQHAVRIQELKTAISKQQKIKNDTYAEFMSSVRLLERHMKGMRQ